MKISLLFFVSFFIVQGLWAQEDMTLSWGTEYNFRKNASYNKLLGVKDGKIYALSSSGDEAKNSIDVQLDVYDAETLTYLSGVTIVENKSNENFEKIVLSDDKLLVFTSHYDRELGLKMLNYREYNEADNTFGPEERIDELPTKEKETTGSFMISSSPNGNHILIYHDNPSPSGNKVFNLKVINYDLTSLWEKELSLNYKEKMVNFKEILIDDGGNVYLMSSINPFGSRRPSGLGSLMNMKSTLFVYRPYEDKLKEFEFALSRNWIDEVRMVFDKDQNLLATAYYTFPNDYKIRGFVLFEMETQNGEVISKKMLTLDKEEFKNIDESVGRLKDYSKMLVGSPGIYPGSSSHMSSTSTEFFMKDVIVGSGSIILVMEAFRRDERCTESFNDQQMIVDCQKNYLYGDIVLFFLNRDLELQRINHVEKMQHAVNKVSPYYSFGISNDDEKIHLFYNDDYRNIENESSALKTPLDNLKEARLNVSSFTLKGDPVNHTIKSTDTQSPYFPGGNCLISPTQLILYSQKEKNYKFGKLSIQ